MKKYNQSKSKLIIDWNKYLFIQIKSSGNKYNGMSRSEPKAKIIYKNLEEIIQRSTVKRSSSAQKSHGTGRQRQNNILRDISNNRSNADNESYQKPKLITKNIKTQAACTLVVDLYGQWFNQVDAIFTQLQDHILLAKQKVLSEIRGTLKRCNEYSSIKQKCSQKVEQIRKMSDYIKHISRYFIENQIPSINNINWKRQNNMNSFSKIYPSSSSNAKLHTTGNHTEHNENYGDSCDRVLELSMKNSKARANRRGDSINNNRKKTVYELILEQKQGRMPINIPFNCKR